MEDRPWLFDDISSLHPQTQLYTSRRSLAEAPSERKYTIADLAAYLATAFGFVQVAGNTAYASDEAAGTAGVAIGEFYELRPDNIYGIPTGNGGILKKRIE
jgi:hypothetical protein